MPTVYTANSKSAAITKAILGACKPCCGSGSSGSGGGVADCTDNNCCGCPVDEDGTGSGGGLSELYVTLDISCWGSITFTISEVTDPLELVVLQGVCGYAYKAVIDTFAPVEEYSFNYSNCVTGAGVSGFSSSSGYTLDVLLWCLRCYDGVGNPCTRWMMEIDFFGQTSSVTHSFSIRCNPQIASCSPQTFTEMDFTATCSDDMSFDPLCSVVAELAGRAVINNTQASTSISGTVGCTITMNMSE